MAADNGFLSLLILLNLTAAFDTADHNIFLRHLQYSNGLSDNDLKWFLYNLTERIPLGDAKSQTHTVMCGVPPGSNLGLTLFTRYMLPLGYVIRKHGISFHGYADDMQLYFKTDPTSSAAVQSSTFTMCLEEIKAWMNHNFLQLNSSKTEAILVGTSHQPQSTPTVLYKVLESDTSVKVQVLYVSRKWL